MKTITVPKSLSHTVTYGMTLCNICFEACRNGARCACCRIPKGIA